MKAKDTLLFNNIITQNPIFVRRAWFGMLYHILLNTMSRDGYSINTKQEKPIM